jgi:hypothetical protein
MKVFYKALGLLRRREERAEGVARRPSFDGLWRRGDSVKTQLLRKLSALD